MQGWLEERNERRRANATRRAADHAAHTTAARRPRTTRRTRARGMKGMATPEQMAALAAANGTDFDRLFLELMIKHHEGAVEMVEELTEQPGSAYEPTLFEFTRDVTNDQNAEIERMNVLLVGLSADARAGSSPASTDAGEAILNLDASRLVAETAGVLRSCEPGQLAAEAARGARRRGRQRRPATTPAAGRRRRPGGGNSTRARRCCRSRTRTWRSATTSWSSAAITASTSTACKASKRRSSCRPSSAPAGRATSRSSAIS